MGLSREGQTHSAKNAKPLLTTIHPFPVTLGEPALVQEVRTQQFHFWVYKERPCPIWLFFKKSRTSLKLSERRRSENALAGCGKPPFCIRAHFNRADCGKTLYEGHGFNRATMGDNR